MKKCKRKLHKFLAYLLVLTMTISLFSYYQSREIKADSKNDVKKEKVTVVKELKDEKTENSNTFLLSDGSKRTDFYAENIRYKEGNTFFDYDNEICETSKRDESIIDGIKDDLNYKYSNRQGNSKVFFSDSLEDGVMLNYGKYNLIMKPVLDLNESNNIEEKSTNNPLETDELDEIGTESEDVEQEDKLQEFKSRINDNKISYTSSSGDIEYQYIALNNGVKENIILNKKPTKYSYDFGIDTKNIYLKQRKNDRGILVCDKSNNKVIGNIEAPFLKDASGKEDYENVKYSLNKSEEGNSRITIEVDKDYFKQNDLEYPITIDPTMIWQFDYLTTASVWSVNFMANTTMAHSSSLTVLNNMMSSYPYNTEERVYLDTTNLLSGSSLLGNGLTITDKYIESACLNLHENTYPYYYTAGIMELRKSLGDWNPSTITWNNQPGVSSDVIASEAMTGDEGESHSLDITSWAQSLADGSQANTGLVFTCASGGAALFYGPEAHYLGQGPNFTGYRHMSISLVYRDMEDYDATINLDASYNETPDKFDLTLEDENELEEGTSVSGYKIFVRKDNANKFKCIATGDDISSIESIDASDVTSNLDIRGCILYSDGTVKVSNIVTLEKHEKETEPPTTIGEETTSEETTTEPTTSETVSPEVTTVEETTINRGFTFDIVTKDTDGDGLEDGYEVWDFKTLWNTETSNSTSENPEYVKDSDEDGLPDGYEVYYQGTNPGEANSFDTTSDDTDNDGYTELEEYQHNTDPYLADSDFDNVGDVADSTPRKTNTHTYSKNDSEAPVHIGMYDKQVTETEDGVSYTKVLNIYSGTIKYLYSNYGDSSLNKKLKYFYDYKGNNTAIMETYDTNSSQDIVITYTYDNNGNNTFICDQSTRYDMTYDSDNRMTNFEVGGNSLLTNQYTNYADNSSEEDYAELNVGDVVTSDENTETYSNNTANKPQKIKTKTITYKTNSDSQISTRTEAYYGNDTSPSYITNLNQEGKILSFYDCSDDSTDPVVYTYTYSGNNQTMTRSDGFIKQLSEVEDATNNKTIKTTTFTFKDIKNQTTNYSTSLETPKEVGENQSSSSKTTLFNNDYYNYTVSADEKVQTGTLVSDFYNDTIMTATSTEVNNTSSTYAVDIYGAGDKTYDYTYDLAGNITEIKKNNTVIYRYSYDPHGRLTREKDYSRGKWIDFSYNETGNMHGKAIYDMDANGNKITSSRVNKLYSYTNSSWPDQLTSYDGDSITYDSVGNPLNYHNGMTFEWKRGRVLDKITLANDDEITYKYDQDNLRTYKNSPDETVYYEWDDTKLLKELVYDKSESKYYDIWYYYDSENNMLGFEYSYVNSAGNKETVKMYYEKNLQGDVIALLDDRGRERVTYTYDAWGNILSHSVDTGWNKAYNLNHITYRGYYHDNESGFYYLQSRYYDSVTGRFVNTDDTNIISAEIGLIYKDNLYIYCYSNPVNNLDDDGTKSINITSKLNSLMIKNAMKLYTMAKLTYITGIIGRVVLLNKFYNLVKTGGEWDLKNKKTWKLKKGNKFVYITSKYSSADIGNIHFGFVGSVLFSRSTLCCGAGIYQIYSGTSKWSYWYTFFDDPRDTFCINIGRVMWKILFLGRSAYQW